MTSAKYEVQSAGWRRTVRSEILHFALRTFRFVLLHNFPAIRTVVVDNESQRRATHECLSFTLATDWGHSARNGRSISEFVASEGDFDS